MSLEPDRVARDWRGAIGEASTILVLSTAICFMITATFLTGTFTQNIYGPPRFQPEKSKPMIDVQSGSVAARFRIESVGVLGLSHPIRVKDAQTGETQTTAAQWRLGVALPADQRGTHMSRFVEALGSRAETPTGLDEFLEFTEALAKTLVADEATASASFAWFRSVAAPISGKSALLECQVTLAATAGAVPTKTITVKVPAKALCPCSKAISDRGAHNQRSDITTSVTLTADAPAPAFGKLIGLVETSASSPVYPLLKREDEKHVTEWAYDHPAFVEDIVRTVAGKLTDLPGLVRFEVEAINRESIHAHDCYARIVYEPRAVTPGSSPRS